MFSPTEPDRYPSTKKETEKDKGPYKPSNKEIFKGLKKEKRKTQGLRPPNRHSSMARGSAQK